MSRGKDTHRKSNNNMEEYIQRVLRSPLFAEIRTVVINIVKST